MLALLSAFSPVPVRSAGAAEPLPAARTATNPATQVQVDVTTLTPRAPHPGQTLQVSGTVTNHGTTTLADVNVQLRLSTSPVEGRSELGALAGSTTRPPGGAVATDALGEPLAPGATAPFALGLPVDGLNLTQPGVYPLAVEVIADDPATQARTRFGAARTFLPWDMGAVKPTRIAVLWPVSSGPTVDADGVPIDHLMRDQLTGRLQALLSAAAGTSVSWLLDGDTLESVQSMAAGAPAPSTGSGTGSTAPPDPTAAAWLAQLRTAVGLQSVWALPYADQDPVSVVRAGLTQDVSTASSLGTDVVASVLGRQLTGTVVGVSWPAEGTADRATLTALQKWAPPQVVLSDTYAEPTRSTTYTPSGVGPLVGTGLTAITTDSTLSRLLATPADQAGGPVLGEQRLLAETAMIGLELPSVSRALVMVPPRGWSPDSDYVHALLHVLDGSPWVTVTELSALVQHPLSGPGRQLPVYPAGVRSRELPPAQMAAVREGHSRLDALTSLLQADAVSVRDTYTRALLRAESAAWRGDRAGGRAYALSVPARLATVQDQVHLVPSGPVTLAARSGRIPVTVVNDLDQRVTVRVVVTAVPSVRMTLTQPAPVTLEPHSSTTLDVAADATTNGAVQVVAHLATSDGQAFGVPQTFAVQVTGFGAVAAGLVVAALALLAVALVVRVLRAIRSGRRPGSPSSARVSAR
jgi:hypothetical protein